MRPNVVPLRAGGISGPNFMLFRPSAVPVVPLAGIPIGGRCDADLARGCRRLRGGAFRDKSGRNFQMTLPRITDTQFLRLIRP